MNDWIYTNALFYLFWENLWMFEWIMLDMYLSKAIISRMDSSAEARIRGETVGNRLGGRNGRSSVSESVRKFEFRCRNFETILLFWRISVFNVEYLICMTIYNWRDLHLRLLLLVVQFKFYCLFVYLLFHTNLFEIMLEKHPRTFKEYMPLDDDILSLPVSSSSSVSMLITIKGPSLSDSENVRLK